MTLHYEIVRILDDNNLIDCESYQRRYWTRDGLPLAQGHYIVLWDEVAEAFAFDEGATYLGPYRSSMLASIELHEFLRAPPRHVAVTGDGAGLRRAA